MVNLQKGLVGHWTFDAGATNNSTAYDSSAYDNHATASNSPKFNESAILNEGVLIDSKDQYFEIDPVDTSDISISLWYRYDGVGSSWNTILGDGNGGDHHLLIDSGGSGDIGFYNSSFYNSGYTLTEGEWYHIVIIKAGTNQKMYINNDLKQDSNDSFDNSSSDNSFETIANYKPGNTQGSLGILDDVRVYERELSSSEVNALYNMRSQRQQNINSIYSESFESGSFSDEWDVTAGDISSNRSYRGDNSFGVWGGGDGVEATLTLEPSGYRRISEFEYYWKEDGSQTGHGVWLYDNNGNIVQKSENENPQWYLNDGSGGRFQVAGYDGQGYNVWTKFTFDFDWQNGTFDYDMRDLDENVVRTGTTDLDKTTGVSEIRFHDAGASGNYIRFDNITVTQ